jgi:hypothetical protein
MNLSKLKELWTGPCTCWFESAFGISWDMSCWAHDMAYDSLTSKPKADLLLFLDVWAIAVVAGEWWQRLIIRANAILMGLAVATVGWIPWGYKWLQRI